MKDAEEYTDLGHIDAPEESPMNDMALASFLTGLGGWVVVVLGFCSLGSSFAVCCLGISLLSWIVAIFTGNFGLREIAASGEAGEKLARWGMFAGAAGFLAGLALAVLLVASALGILSISIIDQLNAVP